MIILETYVNLICYFSFRGIEFKHGLASRGWWSNFLKRHPELTVRTPSLVDPGRVAMSWTSVMDTWFRDAEAFLHKNDLFDVPARIYNIDESWFSPKESKKQKVVTDRNNNMPYKLFGGVRDHTTLTLCICADGSWIPPMITFQTSIPSTTEFLNDGPGNALYNSTQTGHIDSDLYFKYIVHIEPFLNETRPVVIFQDNLGAHCTDQLVDFCIEKKIHIYTFPAKTSHILQPLDKLFGTFKITLEMKKHEAMLIQQSHISKSKLPILTRFTIQATKSDVIRGVFEKTGIYPFDRCKITPDLLVGDEPSIEESHSTNPSSTSAVLVSASTSALAMQVFDDKDNEIMDYRESHQTKSVQTSPVATLSCSTCIANDVKLHPAVASGIVDLELASVFIPDESSMEKSTKSRRKRYSTNGKCLTSDSEIERRREIKAEEATKIELKRQRKEQQDAKKLKNLEEIEAKKTIKMINKRRQIEIKEAEVNAKLGRIGRGSICATCICKIDCSDIVRCLICNTRFHNTCIQEESFITVCVLCKVL